MTEKIYKVKFILPDGQIVKLQCRDTELFERIKERIWKKKEMEVDKKQFAFKLKNFPRLFLDHETFKRLVAVYTDPSAEKIEALVVKKDAESDERNKDLIMVRAKETDTPIQGYLDLMSGISESATATRRYFVLKIDQKVGPTLFYYASEQAFYARESPVTSLAVGNCQALKVDGLKHTFQFIRMEDGGKTGKYVFRADGEISFKMWLHAVRLMNLNLTKQRGTASSVWVPDSAVTKCMRCDQKFTLMRRKHHCRGCGAVVCAECSGYKLMLAGTDENARVCKPCFKDDRKEQKKIASTPSKSKGGDEDDEEEEQNPRSPSSKYDSPSKTGADDLRSQVRSSMAPKGVEGYMEKQSVKGLKPWQRRYFVLDEKGKKLLYYKDKKERLVGAIGQIELKDVKECFHNKDDRCRFDIVSSKKIYPMKTQTPAASSRWVTAINRLTRQMNAPSSPEAVAVKRIGTREATLTPLTQKKDAPKAIQLEGMLKKRHPKSSRFIIAWQDRYFILSQAAKTMTYFKKNPATDKDEKALGTIDLRDIAQCKTDFTTDRKQPQFNIWMKTGRQYCIGCGKETEATHWAKSINTCLAALEPEGRSDKVTPTRVVAPRKGQLPKSEIGWPQLSLNLDVPSLIPIVLRVLRFVGQDDLPQCVVICKLWRVITEEILGGAEEDDDGDEMEGADGGSDDEPPPPGPPEDDDDEEEMPALVIDNGAYTIRAGFAGEAAPKVLLAQASGSLVDPRASGVEAKQQAVQLESLNHFTDSKQTWISLEKVWRNIFTQLKAEPHSRKVMLTQPILAPIFVGNNMQKILFEKFKAPAAHLATAPILTAYSYGVFTGLVIDIGHTSAQVCPIVEGYLKEAAVRRSPHLGGEAMTRRMYKFLEYTDVKKLPLVEALNVARIVKEKYCFCVKDPDKFNAVLKDPKCKVDYILPTKVTITIGKALPSIGEMYFDPRKVSGDKDDSIKGIQELIEDSINASELDTRTELLQNILLSGGGTLMKGFVDRLTYELKKTLPHAADAIRIHADKDRQNAVWRGAAVLANLDVFQRKWTKREEYMASR